MLPVLFFVSAICVGLSMVIVLSRLSSNAFGHRIDLPLLSDLGRILIAALGVYFVARIFDLGHRGQLGAAFGLSYESILFQLEFVLGVIVPGLMLANVRRRADRRYLYAASLLVVFGFVANRLNVSITGFEAAQGGHYVPAWQEVLVTLMLVALVFGAFSLAVRQLEVYPRPVAVHPPPLTKHSLARFQTAVSGNPAHQLRAEASVRPEVN
jgi:Ni/Fe-hydrogenase subunit HybB-like protein